MKTNRSFLPLVGFFVAFLALGVSGSRAQNLHSTEFVGTVTLPFAAQWGELTLPAGEYKISYGALFDGSEFVAVEGKAEGSPHGLILPIEKKESAATNKKNDLVCIRQGRDGIVRELEMPAIGKTVSFAMPRGEQLIAHNRKGSANTQLAGGPTLIERLPVTPSGK